MRQRLSHVLFAGALLAGCSRGTGCGTGTGTGVSGGPGPGPGAGLGTGTTGTSITLSGTVANRAGSCPAITFTLAGSTVTAGQGTEFDGRTCERTVDGAQVDVEGTVQVNRSVVATKIDGDDDDRDGDDGGRAGAAVELEGPVTGKSGSCPALSFWVAGTQVTTHRNTEFDDTACGRLAERDEVQVEGTRQSNGSVLASKVEKDD